MLYVLLVTLLRPILWLLLRPRIFGRRENLRIKGGAIFICNHRALLDPVMLAVISPRLIHFMAKKELFDTKIGSLFFRSLLVFPVSRKSADIKSLKKAMELLHSGKAFGIFPEGRRSVTEGMDEFERGAAYIAVKSRAPIVPIYISPESYRGTFRLKVMVGDVIRVEELEKCCERRRLTDVLTNEMKNAMEELQFDMRQRLKRK